MKIGIIGVGMVGEVVKYGMERLGHDVIAYDTKWAYGRIGMVLDTDLVFVCVPTPSMPDGSCNTLIVEDVVLQLSNLKYGGCVVIKSTVTPGTTRKLGAAFDMRIAFCPEFLKEKSRFVDFVENHDVCIIGVDGDNVETFDLIKEAHGSFPKRFEWLTTTEAEMAKYFSNCFNALRIVFANQFYEVCQEIGCDYTAVKNAIVKRSTIGDNYLECNKNFRAFGGNCLPKDLKAFMRFSEAMGAKELLWRDLITLNEWADEGGRL